MLELLKNEQLLLGERSESDHSSKKECFLTLTCPMATPIAHRALPPLQLPLSGRCQDRPIYVRMTKFMLSPIFFLPWKCRSPQKPSSILSDCTWSGNSLLKLKTKFEYKGGCGRHWCFSPEFPILLWAWWGLPFPTFLRLDVTLWLAWTNDM